MTARRDIPWFNPRQMDNETVLALSTGREALLREFFHAVDQREQEPAAGHHWLVTGPRGAGKSFFLRLVQVTFSNRPGTDTTFVLLPEEMPNVFSPHEFLREVERMLPGNAGNQGTPPSWQVKDESASWNTALESLLRACKTKLLVIGAENFDQLLKLAFDSEVRASRLRNLLENEPRIMLLATAVEGDFDEDYGKRLFRQFEHHTMPRWDQKDHRLYLEKRAKLQGKDATTSQLARIDAYSRFTGGSARVAAILAAAILDEQDPLHASSDLTATLDRMSDYYRALHEKMPVNTRKVFDALVRGGEPASQVEIADRIQARQNEISRAFRWLTDYGYVVNDAAPGRKEHRYRVADRLFVQFYRMRYLEPDQPSQLAILADLLATMIEFNEKWRFAQKYLDLGLKDEAQQMAELACAERGVDVNLLKEDSRSADRLLEMGKEWKFLDGLQLATGSDYVHKLTIECFERFDTDEAMQAALNETRALALAVRRDGVDGSELVKLAEDSHIHTPLELYRTFAIILDPRYGEEFWEKGIDGWKDAIANQSTITANSPSLLDQWKQKQANNRRYPLAASLYAFAKRRIDGELPEYTNAFTFPQATQWAARAAKLWFEHDCDYLANKAVQLCAYGIVQPTNKSEGAQGTLAILEILRLYFDRMSDDSQVGFELTKGWLLQALGRHTEAISAFKAASEKSVLPNNARKFSEPFEGFLHDSIAGSLAALGDAESAVSHLRTARRAHLASGKVTMADFSLGHIARYTLALQSMQDAWAIIEAETNSTVSHVTFRSFFEAIPDAFRTHGEIKAIELYRALLLEIAKRPNNDLEIAITVLVNVILESDIRLSMIREMIDELPSIVGPEVKPLESTMVTLLAWIAYLACTPEQRSESQQSLTPEVATMIKSLNELLSPAAIARYKLEPPPGAVGD